MGLGAFNDNQLVVLRALCDAVFQGHTGAEAADILSAVPLDAPDWQRAKVERFVSSKFSDFPGALEGLVNQFSLALSADNVNALTMTLSLMYTRAGALALTGRPTPFQDLTPKEREAVLLGWKSSWILLLRKAYRGFVCICLYVAYTNIDDNALAIGYPALGDPSREVDAKRIKKHIPYVFEKVSVPYQYIDTDVLVIGSGAGGGVVSSEISKKGWKTLVVEKGSYVKVEEMLGTPRDGLTRLYEGSGLMASEDGSVNVLAGSTFGGGTTVNWSASLRPQHFLREAWARDFGLPYFLSKEYTDSIEYVCSRMGVSHTAIEHNKPNQRLIEGAFKLGYHNDRIPQNTAGVPHRCGFCSFGCPFGEKQGGTVSWLADAAKQGARFMVETDVERILFAADKNGPSPTEDTLKNFFPSAARRHAIGALVRTADGKRAIIRAKEAVVVSGGSINSPAILLKSGLKNPRIGKNLHLHPTSYITGFYDETINPWEGSIMTGLSNVQENRDGSHHGIKLEVNMSFPGGSAGSFIKWNNSLDHKRSMVQYNNAFTLIAIARDRDSGAIFLDSENKPRMDYTISPYDGLSVIKGVIAGAEVHLAAGAKRIVTAQTGVEDYYPAPGHQYLADPKWLEWREKVEKAGAHPSWIALGSAHQMGSCQMGTKPLQSVVDPRGRVWGTHGLYVADASVFPTASGVNPMITNMSLSHSIAQFIDQDLRQAGSSAVEARL